MFHRVFINSGENYISVFKAQINCAAASHGLQGEEEFNGLVSGFRRNAADICAAFSEFYAAQDGSFFTD